MAGRILAFSARLKSRLQIPIGTAGAHHDAKSIFGNREMVGFGINGQPGYMDRPDFPMPALRWKENVGEIAVSSYLDTYISVATVNKCVNRILRKIKYFQYPSKQNARKTIFVPLNYLFISDIHKKLNYDI